MPDELWMEIHDVVQETGVKTIPKKSALLKRYIKDASKAGITHVTVNSSPYAVDFYHKIGFVDVREEIERDGIRFTPMRMEL